MNINPLRSARSLLVAALPVLALAATQSDAGISFQTGSDFMITDRVLEGTAKVFDLNGSPTTLTAYNTIVNGSFQTHDNSTVIGHHITTSQNLQFYNNSQSEFNNSSVGNSVLGYNNAEFTLNNSSVDMHVLTYNNSNATIISTTISGTVAAYNDSTITLKEGSLPVDGITTFASALVIIEAMSFDQGFGLLQGTGTITGQLTNGERFSVNYQTHDESSIQLVGTTSVPAPGALAVLGLAALPLSRSRRR